MNRIRALRLSCASLSLVIAAQTSAATLAWLADGKPVIRPLDTQEPVSVAPLGSLWKLYVFAYLGETGASEPVYRCPSTPMQAGDENLYCCEPGESVGRDLALARSCAPYFAPERLGIEAGRWRQFWQGRHAPEWLTELDRLQPQTEVPVAQILQSLHEFSPVARESARKALLQTAIEGYGRDAWPQLGSGLRYKTYSWRLPDGRAFGGAAGWLVDGTPFWFGATGSSRSALRQWSTRIAGTLPEPDWTATPAESQCVDVNFFSRYPLRGVWQGNEPARPGRMAGKYRLEFANDNQLAIRAGGDMLLQPGDPPQISGRFGLNEYVARVIDREGHAQEQPAARALAVAARSYLLQNGEFKGGCWQISDSTRTQRVSPNPPGNAALAAAWFTDGLILDGVPVQYHLDRAGENRLSWMDALQQSGHGWSFEQILREAYPGATLMAQDGSRDCRRLPAAESWLTGAAAHWQARLLREPGFEPLDTGVQVCALRAGRPYADQQRLRIHARGWRSLDERITLAHEYLHLVFRFHPNGADEEYIERLARRLIEG